MSAPEKDTEELLAERQRVEEEAEHRFPDRDVPPAEEREPTVRGEADQIIPPDA